MTGPSRGEGRNIFRPYTPFNAAVCTLRAIDPKR